MTQRKARASDAANYLDTQDHLAEYLRRVFVDNDPIELAAALGDIARARGMSQLAADTGLSHVRPK